jgi:thymidine kinase
MPELEEKVHKEEKLKSLQNNKYIYNLFQGSNDKVVKNLVKKMGAQQIGVDEINFFRDDNTIMHFVRPEGI